MKNPIIYIAILLSILALSSCSTEPFESAPLEAKNAAQEALKTYKILANEDFQAHGFTSESELQAASLGAGISIHYMNIPNLSLHNLTKDPEELINDGDEWMFEVLGSGGVKSSITVQNTNGSWKVTEMGNSEISQSISEVKNKHMAENELEQDAYRVVRIPGMYLYWVSYKEKAKNYFIHVSDRVDLGQAKNKVQSAKDVISDIFQSVKDFKSAIEEP